MYLTYILYYISYIFSLIYEKESSLLFLPFSPLASCMISTFVCIYIQARVVSVNCYFSFIGCYLLHTLKLSETQWILIPLVKKTLFKMKH